MGNVKTVSDGAYVESKDGKKILLNISETATRATCTTPNWILLNQDITEPIAIDLEFQRFKPKDETSWKHRIGRVGIVNTRGETLYDVYARYEFDETYDVATGPAMYNVSWKDLSFRNGAKEAAEVLENLKKIMSGRPIVGHGMSNDLKAVDTEIWAAGASIFDIQSYYGQKKLEALATAHLPGEIYNFHDPVDDARATMLLYLRVPGRSYKGRDSFKDPPFQLDSSQNDFPTLGAAAAMGKKKKR